MRGYLSSAGKDEVGIGYFDKNVKPCNLLRTPARIYIPNLRLIKHKRGAKIMPKL